jgi:hypothetical protein
MIIINLIAMWIKLFQKKKICIDNCSPHRRGNIIFVERPNKKDKKGVFFLMQKDYTQQTGKELWIQKILLTNHS